MKSSINEITINWQNVKTLWRKEKFAQFLCLPQCFQNLSAVEASESIYMLGRIKTSSGDKFLLSEFAQWILAPLPDQLCLYIMVNCPSFVCFKLTFEFKQLLPFSHCEGQFWGNSQSPLLDSFNCFGQGKILISIETILLKYF